MDTSKETLFEAMKLGYAKHHDNECSINAFIDHYAYTLMKDNKRTIIIRENIIKMMANKATCFIE